MNYSGKRILLLLPEVFQSAGGIQTFCRSLCLAAGRWAQANGALLDAITLNDCVDPDTRYVNGGFHSYTGARKNKAKFINSFLRRVITARPDLILIGHVSLSPLALLVASRRVKTCIIGYGVDVWRPLGWAERKALRGASAVLAISEFTRDELIRRNGLAPDRVRLFPCSLDPHWLAADSSEQTTPPMLLTVCRLMKEDSYKGVDSVIRSLPAVIEEAGAIDYRIVGDGDDLPRLKRLAEETGVSKHVTFTGSISGGDLMEHYGKCSVFVMPSEGEGFGIVFLEAMAHAKPVIGGAHAGTPFVIENGKSGILVDRTDTAALSRAIIRVLKSKELSEQLGRAGRERLRRLFTFEQFESNLGSLLRSQLSD
jgi:glycosyltransferase involved in cell wall biosynthesis